MSKPISNKTETKIFAKTMFDLIPKGKMTEWAKKFGVSSESVSTYREGTIPRGDILLRISQKTGMSMEKLLTGKEVNKPYQDKELHDKIEEILLCNGAEVVEEMRHQVKKLYRRGIEMKELKDMMQQLLKESREEESGDGKEPGEALPLIKQPTPLTKESP